MESFIKEEIVEFPCLCDWERRAILIGGSQKAGDLACPKPREAIGTGPWPQLAKGGCGEITFLIAVHQAALYLSLQRLYLNREFQIHSRTAAAPVHCLSSLRSGAYSGLLRAAGIVGYSGGTGD